MNNAEKRAAFYQAASNIEARPELYDFGEVRVGEENCPACMWGHVGRALKMEPGTLIYDIARLVVADSTNTLYEHTSELVPRYGYLKDAALAAKKLRSFADKHFPGDQNPAHKSAGVSFSELMASLNEVSS